MGHSDILSYPSSKLRRRIREFQQWSISWRSVFQGSYFRKHMSTIRSKLFAFQITPRLFEDYVIIRGKTWFFMTEKTCRRIILDLYALNAQTSYFTKRGHFSLAFQNCTYAQKCGLEKCNLRTFPFGLRATTDSFLKLISWTKTQWSARNSFRTSMLVLGLVMIKCSFDHQRDIIWSPFLNDKRWKGLIFKATGTDTILRKIALLVGKKYSRKTMWRFVTNYLLTIQYYCGWNVSYCDKVWCFEI